MNTASYLGASLCPRGRFAGSRSSRREGGIGRARALLAHTTPSAGTATCPSGCVMLVCISKIILSPGICLR